MTDINQPTAADRPRSGNSPNIAYGSTLGMILTSLLGRYGIAEVCDRLASVTHEKGDLAEAAGNVEAAKLWHKLTGAFEETVYTAMELEDVSQEYSFFEF